MFPFKCLYQLRWSLWYFQETNFSLDDYDLYFSDISSKASSYRLLAGTNEFAEDLTGQRMPLNASQWKSETKVRFDRNEIMQCQGIR